MSVSWWRASLRLRPLASLLGGWPAPLLWTSATLGSGCAEVWAQDQDTRPALQSQQNDGWSVGDEGLPLAFPGAQAADVTGGAGWQQALTNLAARMTPAQARWQPYYVPALFQSLEDVRSNDLRFAIRPVFTPEMAVAGQRGEALLSLLMEDGVCRRDVALVLDVPGPQAVALAASLTRCFDPVFVFDNWPHPRGVVPAHLTLGAALYYLPVFERARTDRALATAAPMFVLDRQRLSPYDDDASQFDNRYFAGLPAPEALQAAGIRHVLYVTPDQQVTLDADDLNDDLVALDQGGIDVKMLALSDFSETLLPGWLDAASPQCPPAPLAGPRRFYFGGSPTTHGCFTWWYGWRAPSLPSLIPTGGAQPIPIPPSLAPRCRFRPATRPCHGMLGMHGGSGGGRGSGFHFGSFGHGGSMGRAHGGFGG